MKKINSGINLFKLFSMFMIVVLHIIGRGGVVYNVVGARFFGAYMKKYRVGEKMKKHITLLLYVFCAAGSFFFSFYFKFVMKNFLKFNVNYLQYTSPFIILCAVFLFIFFSKLSFGERG